MQICDTYWSTTAPLISLKSIRHFVETGTEISLSISTPCPSYMKESTPAAFLRESHVKIFDCPFASHFLQLWSDLNTVYPKKYAHGFCFAVLCCGYTLTDFPISIRLTSLALWQSNDCPSASKATLMNMDKYFMWIHYQRLHNHNKAKHNKTACIFLGIYCRWEGLVTGTKLHYCLFIWNVTDRKHETLSFPLWPLA